MIRPRYTIKLARTKLRSKRGMLFASIVISSLLFAVLVAGIILFTGAEKSAVTLIERANNGKYLVQVQPVIPGGSIAGLEPFHLTADDIASIRAFETDYYARLKATYKKQNIAYREPSPEDSLLTPDSFASPGTPTDLRYRINFRSPLMQKFQEERFVLYAKTAKNTVIHLKQLAAHYGGSGYYASTTYPVSIIPGQLLITDGRENFNDQELKTGDMTPYGYFTHAVHNSTYGVQDKSLMDRYITQPANAEPKGVPVIVSAQEAAELFGKDKGIGKEPKSDTEKVAWLKQVQQKLTGTTYQTCYRNEAEQDRIKKIQQDYADMQNHKNDKEYIKPALLYDYPATACGDIVVKSDTRTKAEKDAEAQTIRDQQKLGTYVAPAHRLITYQIVGLVEAQPYSQYTSSVSSYLKNLLSYNANSMTAIVPAQLYQQLPASFKVDDLAAAATNPDYKKATESLAPRVVAFGTIDQARRFMQNETCPESVVDCKKLFTADPYGSNYLILDEIGTLFVKLATYALPVALLLATVIIWFTMSRVMAENRKETAVYRAMGAKRLDIALIYVTYTLNVALRIAVVSLGMGILAAYVINQVYGAQLTAIAMTSFGVVDSSAPRFNLFDLTSPYILYIAGAIIVVCFVAVLHPLVRNVRRDPIRDMREE